MSTASAASGEIAATQGGAVTLAAGPTAVLLEPADHIDIAAALTEPKNRRFSLMLRDLATNRPPGTGYAVYLNLPKGATPGPQDPGLAGTLSFFGVNPATQGGGRAVSFEVSEVLQRLQAAGRLGNALTVTIIPAGAPKPDSHPTIGHIALFAD